MDLDEDEEIDEDVRRIMLKLSIAGIPDEVQEHFINHIDYIDDEDLIALEDALDKDGEKEHIKDDSVRSFLEIYKDICEKISRVQVDETQSILEEVKNQIQDISKDD